MKFIKCVSIVAVMLVASSFATAQTYYKIESAWGGKVLDVTNAATEDGTTIQQWEYTGALWQNWTLEDIGNGQVMIKNRWTGKVLDVPAGSYNNGEVIQQWSFTGQGPWQNWIIENLGDGTVVIKNAWTNKVLDVTSGSMANGAVIQQWEYTGAPWQKWRLVDPNGNMPPAPSISVDNINSGASVAPATTVTIRFAASDIDGNLAGIRFNIWNASTGYFDNGNGAFVVKTGLSGEVVVTITLDTLGQWFFWTDATDATGSYVSTGDWSKGFAILVQEDTPPPDDGGGESF